ncbi:SusC/RagA family TonB-linked outer membrane protein [Flavisolibacter tropicus]|uniref:TonB-dependent receptor n=1 Tax=Flavisolibacter tropicus TaxID=1492898 RepID=A0A172TQ24_9BACT|nr:SusC/RagA family TonB-linked outer membrane protein [Flavisolibacter tropicus]ANE49151.1 TonB-dependent receptor [Flavisolibacter tropicus]
MDVLKRLLMAAACLLVTFVGFAQSRQITGTVLSQTDNTPLQGVTVTNRNTKQNTQTAANGTFSINAEKGHVLVLSYVGFVNQNYTVSDENNVGIILSSSKNNTLEDVVVVGYASQKRGNVTGSVSTVDVKKTLGGRPIADVGRGLQGAASGLSVTIPSGEVGSDPIIKIRGQIGSLEGGNKPLILLDNVEIPSIQVVNPNDIESITVLKDAASASIYGSKASFGVILITTKKGSGNGKPQINYSNNFSYQNVWKDLKMADVNGLKYTVDAAERIGTFTPTGAFYYVDRASYEKAVAWKEQYGNTIGPNDPTVFGRDWYVQGATNQKMGVRTYDPYDYMVKEWAPTQQHDLSVGLTQGKTSYNLGLGLLDQSGMLKPAKVDKFSRYNASLKLSSELNKYLTIRGGALYSRRNKEYAYATNSTTADPWLYLYRWSSLYPLGNDENGDAIRSPYSEVAAANTANILQNYSNLNLGSTVKITNDWKVDFDYTFSNQEEMWNRPGTRFTARNSWVAPKARVDASGNPVYVNNEGQVVSSTTPGAIRAFDLSLDAYTALGSNPDHFARTATNFFSHTINAYTTYGLNLNEDNVFKFILGVNRVTATTEWQSSQITGLSNIENPQFNFGTGTQTIAGDKTWESQLGYFGRINYAFRNKYLLEGNLRYDGSSKFMSSLWWRWYPSFSAGWVASEEEFLQWMKPVVNSLKFRGSWGTIGDQTVPNGLYISTLPGGAATWIGANGARVAYTGTPSAVFSDIQWQDVESKNLGVDVAVLNNKINFTFDLFERNTNNMIMPLEGIPFTFGAPAPLGNFGSLQTRGWEFSMNFNHRFKNGLGINFRGNISDAKSTLTDYGTGTQVTSNYTGKTIGEIWGYRTDRLYQLEDFELGADGKPILVTLTAAESALNGGKKAYKLKPGVDGKKPVYQPFLQNSSNFYFGPGDVKFRDLNGDGEISNGSGTLANHGDLEVIGNSTPRYEYGFRLGADYKGFDFGAFFQGVGSRQIWGDGFLAIPGYNSADGAMPEAIAGNYWTPQNTNAFYPAAYNNAASNSTNNMQVQDRYLLNMAYLRLKNVTVGYTLPKSVMSKVKMNTLRVYVGLENFITWDHLGDLPIDPESINGYSMWNTSNYNSSRTGTGVPAFKSVSFGAQLNF